MAMLGFGNNENYIDLLQDEYMNDENYFDILPDELMNNENYIDILPDELLLHIFQYLSMDDVLSCEMVCIRWMVLSRDLSLWRNNVIIFNGRQSDFHVPETTYELISSHAELIHCIKLLSIDNYARVVLVTKICDNLTSLELTMCRIAPEFVSYVMKWPKLKKLDLKNCYTGPVNEFDYSIQYDYFKELSYLSLSDFGLSASNCTTLLHCQFLTHILIEKIKNLELKFIQELILSKKQILVALHVHGGDAIDDDCLELLRECPHLNDLAIIRCENLTDRGFAALANMKSLQHLHIWNNNNFTETVLLETLASPILKNLLRLSFSKILNVSPVVADLISEYYKNLKFLALYQCPKVINTDYEKQLKTKFRNIDVVLY